MDIAKGGLLGGVYAYLDNNNQMVLIDGTNHLLRIAHSRDERGAWHLVVTESTDLFSAIPSGDSSFGVVPDYLGNVWFATAIGVVGVSKIGDGVARISPGEQVANSIPASPKNPVAVATTFALYKSISTAWATRRPYLRTWPRPQPGPTEPGNRLHPNIFRPHGCRLRDIVDNAEPQVHALVYQSGTGALIRQQTVLTLDGPGSENSPIGVGSSVFIASTYGYPYPADPPGAGPAVSGNGAVRGRYDQGGY